MSRQTMERIEAILNEADSLPPAKREELKILLAELRAEVETLDQTDADRARSVAGFTEIATHEATRASACPNRVGHATAGLLSTIEELEAEHPKLVRIVNQICTTLSDMGL